MGRAVTIPRPPGAASSPADEFNFEEQFFEITATFSIWFTSKARSGAVRPLVRNPSSWAFTARPAEVKAHDEDPAVLATSADHGAISITTSVSSGT